MQAFIILCWVLCGTLLSAQIGEVEGCGARGAETRKRTAANEAQALREELFGNAKDVYFDPAFDFDLTNIKDDGSEHWRGGEQYERPYGWMRLALKVKGKYRDGDGWLGTGADAWPVSYHGTSIQGAKDIIRSHYKAGGRGAFGRGIYSSPDVEYAEYYTTTFTSERTHKTYRVVLQNRINPKIKKEVVPLEWLVPVPAGTSAEKEKAIAENSIRPYGLLLKEVNPRDELK